MFDLAQTSRHPPRPVTSPICLTTGRTAANHVYHTKVRVLRNCCEKIVSRVGDLRNSYELASPASVQSEKRRRLGHKRGASNRRSVGRTQVGAEAFVSKRHKSRSVAVVASKRRAQQPSRAPEEHRAREEWERESREKFCPITGATAVDRPDAGRPRSTAQYVHAGHKIGATR
jgi:hypothetical protein